MAADMQQAVSGRPLIWVLKGLRAGDTAQAMALALQLGGRVEGKQLAFNAGHALPNGFVGPRIWHVTAEARSQLKPPWPDLVVATGRRTAPVALWVKAQSQGKAKLVQIGRPRMALPLFDLVLTTPQYGLPKAANVMVLPLPLALPKAAAAAVLAQTLDLWKDLPRPWTLAVIGGEKYPLRLGREELSAYGSLLSRQVAETGGSVVLLDSPRSPKGALDLVRSQLAVPHWAWVRGQGENPYAAALGLCDVHVVTSDSVSMVTEMILSGKPVQVFMLPRAALAPRWQAEKGMLAALAARGVLHPPRDVQGFMQGLMARKLLGDLAMGTHVAANPDHERDFGAAHFADALARVRALLKA